MTDNVIEPKADAQGDKLDAIMSLLGKTITRLDEMEKNLPAPPLTSAADKKAKADEDKAEMKDDEMEKPAPVEKSDAEGSNPKVHGQAGEIKPDEDEEKCDEDEEESKMDEDEKAMKADEEESKYADCQAKADSVYSAFGKSASRPLQGESLINYRKRMLRGLQAHSDEMKNININKIADEAMLDLVEKRIYADALQASRGTGAIGRGQLIPVYKKDQAGRTITEYRGDMEAWLGEFKLPTSRVVKFNIENFKR